MNFLFYIRNLNKNIIVISNLMRAVIEITINIDKLTKDNIDKVIDEIHDFLANNHDVGYLLVDERGDWLLTNSKEAALLSTVAFDTKKFISKNAIRNQLLS